MTEIIVSEDTIIATLNRYPDLTPNGFGGSDLRAFSVAAERQVAQVQRLVAHLRKYYPKGTQINTNTSSYGLKHDYERHTSEYVTNGVFILAALIAGYEHRVYGLNACFNVRHRNAVRAPGCVSRWSGRSVESAAPPAATTEAADIDWKAEEYFAGQFMTLRDAAEAIVADCVIDVQSSYDPSDEQDPAAAFETVLREDLRIDGAPFTDSAALADELRDQTRTDVWSEQPRPGCPLGRYVVTIQGEAFRGSLIDTARGWMFQPDRKS